MLTQVADGVLVHQGELFQNNTVGVQGRAGVLLGSRRRRTMIESGEAGGA